MKKLPPLPEIPAAEQTPWATALVDIIEKLGERVQHLEEENGRLKDEIAILKGEKAQPKFKPSRMEPEADSKQKATEQKAGGKRAGSEKRSRKVGAGFSPRGSRTGQSRAKARSHRESRYQATCISPVINPYAQT